MKTYRILSYERRPNFSTFHLPCGRLANKTPVADFLLRLRARKSKIFLAKEKIANGGYGANIRDGKITPHQLHWPAGRRRQQKFCVP